MLGLRRSAEFSANSLKTHKYNLWFKFARHQTGYVLQGNFRKLLINLQIPQRSVNLLHRNRGNQDVFLLKPKICCKLFVIDSGVPDREIRPRMGPLSTLRNRPMEGAKTQNWGSGRICFSHYMSCVCVVCLR